jgi:hypothetical protein
LSTATFWFFLAPVAPDQGWEGRPGHFHRLVALGAIGEGGKIRQHGERKGAATGETRRPDDDLDLAVIARGLLRVLLTKGGRTVWPGLAEADEIVIGVEHDRRDAEQSRFFEDTAQQHGLAGPWSRKNRDVARQEARRKPKEAKAGAPCGSALAV